MTQPLAAESPRRAAARAFGLRLRRRMRAQRIGRRRLASLAGVASSAVYAWIAGDNLPTLATAARLAEALGDEQLLEIVRAARHGRCALCGRSFINEGGGPKRYCSSRCREMADARRRYGSTASPERVLVAGIRVEIGRADGPQASGLAQLVDEYRRRRRSSLYLERRLRLHEEAIDAMCLSCEPGGRCHTPDCALRAVSRLPLEAPAAIG
jgi:transcriptional regulator with XRE-family HTH domain